MCVILGRFVLLSVMWWLRYGLRCAFSEMNASLPPSASYICAHAQTSLCPLLVSGELISTNFPKKIYVYSIPAAICFEIFTFLWFRRPTIVAKIEIFLVKVLWNIISLSLENEIGFQQFGKFHFAWNVCDVYSFGNNIKVGVIKLQARTKIFVYLNRYILFLWLDWWLTSTYIWYLNKTWIFMIIFMYQCITTLHYEKYHFTCMPTLS